MPVDHKKRCMLRASACLEKTTDTYKLKRFIYFKYYCDSEWLDGAVGCGGMQEDRDKGWIEI